MTKNPHIWESSFYLIFCQSSNRLIIAAVVLCGPTNPNRCCSFSSPGLKSDECQAFVLLLEPCNKAQKQGVTRNGQGFSDTKPPTWHLIRSLSTAWTPNRHGAKDTLWRHIHDECWEVRGICGKDKGRYIHISHIGDFLCVSSVCVNECSLLY